MRKNEFIKTILGAVLIVFVSGYSMKYLFNNAPGTNNKLAFTSAGITAATFVFARFVRVV